MIIRNLRADSVEFQFPATNAAPSPRTPRLRIAALSCGAVRVTRTLRDAFLDRSGDTVIGARPGKCRVAEAEGAATVGCGGVREPLINCSQFSMMDNFVMKRC